jgi:hypothetical protein
MWCRSRSRYTIQLFRFVRFEKAIPYLSIFFIFFYLSIAQADELAQKAHRRAVRARAKAEDAAKRLGDMIGYVPDNDPKESTTQSNPK